MALTITPYAGQGWTDNSTPDLSAETLNAVDAGITANSNAINAIANAVVSQIVNDPNKIASMAALYAVNGNLSKIISGTAIIDPNGKNYVDIPITGISANWAPIAFNGDYDTYAGYVLGCVSQNNNLRVYLSTARTGVMRVNYFYFIK